MAHGFNTEFRSQQEWGWLLATWLFLSGSGSGLFLLFKVFNLPLAYALLSLGTIVLGGIVLLLELGNPIRAWRGVSRLATSWLSRGALSVSLFVLFGFLSVAPRLAAWLPWSEGGTLSSVLGWVAALCALMITLYPGFFLAKNRSIPFWNTALFPAISFGFALMGACGLALIAAALVGGDLRGIELLAAVLIVADFVMVVVHLTGMDAAGGAARESVRLLKLAPMRWSFPAGVFLVGMILPLLIIGWARSALPFAGACMLVGCFAFRYCVLKVGVYVPPALVSGGIDLSKLKRGSADLKREYAGVSARYAGGRG